MVLNATATVTTPSVIGEFGKAFNGAGAHVISRTRLGDRKGGRAFWAVGSKISTKAQGCERSWRLKLQSWGKARLSSAVRAEAFELFCRPCCGWRLGTGALKQGSDIRVNAGVWGLRENYHWWIIWVINQNAGTGSRGS